MYTSGATVHNMPFRNLQSLTIFIAKYFVEHSTETCFARCPTCSAAVHCHLPLARTFQVPKLTVPTSAHVPFQYRHVFVLPYVERARWMRLCTNIRFASSNLKVGIIFVPYE